MHIIVQKVWRAREKRCSRGKGLPLGGYNTGIFMESNTDLEDPDDLVFFFNSHDQLFVVFLLAKLTVKMQSVTTHTSFIYVLLCV